MKQLGAWGGGPVVAALIGFTLAAHAPGLSSAFVDWDDHQNFLHNPGFQGLGWQNLRWALTTHHMGVYQPVSWLLLEVEFSLWGLHPLGYHVTGLLFHVLDMLLLFGLARDLLRRGRSPAEAGGEGAIVLGAASAVLLFAVHPLRVETVAWASCQPYQLSFFFALLALRLYLRAAEGDRWRSVGTLVLVAAAMASKSVAVTLPLLFVLIDFHPLRRLGWRRDSGAGRVWREKVPLFILMGLCAHQAVRAKAVVGALDSDSYRLGTGLAQASYSTLFYLAKTLIPIDLSPYYPRPADIDAGLGRPLYLACFVLILGVTVLAVRHARRWPALAVAWLAYLVALAPNSGLVRISDQVAADRYAYLPSLGLIVLAAAGFARLAAAPRVYRSVAATGFLVVALTLTRATRRQSRLWTDSDALWTHAFRLHGREDGVLQSNYATIFLDKGQPAEALAHLDVAARLSPGNAGVHRNRAAALYFLKRHSEALESARRALSLDPNDPDAHLGAGAALLELGHAEEAVRQIERALEIDPQLAGAREMLDRARRITRAARAAPP